MRVFVTGGAGFLGRKIVAQAAAFGHDVLAPRRTECDLADKDAIARWLADRTREGRAVEAIVHSAAHYGGLQITLSEPADIFFKNVRMTSNLFEAAARAGVRRIVSVGSACGYPGGIAGDMAERDFWQGPLHESVEAYGFTKKVQLVAQRAYHKQHGIEGVHLVPTNLYGPHDTFTEYRGHAISVLIKRYVDAAIEKKPEVANWGDGSAVREFLHVDDAAWVIARALTLPHDLEPLNVGTGVGTSIRELTDLIAELSGFEGRVAWDTSKPNGVPRKVLDPVRLRSVLPDFTPRPLRAGLRETIDWYREHKAEADARM